ncbi:MAG: DUF4180 domain-containing protein [Pseudomonadales bacterium]|nr:DUF4180 domain-containing protein [Pseudomonadales bacterium]
MSHETSKATVRLGSRDDLFALVGEGVLVLDETEVDGRFFDLRTGFAGDVLQTCVNYGLRLAVVVADPARHGERFVELVREHRSHRVVRFPASRAEAEAWAGRDR